MNMLPARHIACVLSGSTESAVAALVLKRNGYGVLGVCVKNPFKTSRQHEEESDYAHKVSQHLEIPLHEISLPKEDWNQFLSSVTTDYKNGYMSHVEMLYNKHITYGSLFDYVIKQVGVDGLATDHYARRSYPGDLSSHVRRHGVKLYKAFDQLHDQSMLLSQVRQKCLQRSLMPIGELPPEVVPKLAQSAGVPVAEKCLERSMRASNHAVKVMDTDNMEKTYKSQWDGHQVLLLRKGKDVDMDMLLTAVNQEVPRKAGNFVNLLSGAVEDIHEGVQEYAVGDVVHIAEQMFCVVSKDIETGNITVAHGKDHPALYSDTLFTSLAHWIHSVPYNFYEKHTMDCEFRMKMQQPLTQCTLTVGAHNEWCGNDHIILSSVHKIKAVNRGHFVVFYKGEECIGSAKILRSGPSQYIMNFNKINNGHTRTPSKPSGFTFKTFFKKILNS